MHVHMCKCNYTSMCVCVHLYTQLHIDTHENRKEKEDRNWTQIRQERERRKRSHACPVLTPASRLPPHTNWRNLSLLGAITTLFTLLPNFSVVCQCQQTNVKKTVPLFSPEHNNNDKRNNTKMSTVNTDGFLKSFVYPRLLLWGGGDALSIKNSF